MKKLLPKIFWNTTSVVSQYRWRIWRDIKKKVIFRFKFSYRW